MANRRFSGVGTPEEAPREKAQEALWGEEASAGAPDAASEKGPPRGRRPWWLRAHWHKAGIFLVSLALFILAIMLMKEGARDLGPLVRDRFNVNNAADSLGFGWLFAYLIMSGSPVAAVALTFFDAGAVSRVGAYTMITGSRLGASLIVLIIGLIYVLRGRDRVTSLSMGLLSLVVTGSTHLLALPLGLVLLTAGALDAFQPEAGGLVTSATDALFGPIVDILLRWLPRWGLFVVGFAIIMVSFSLFDRALPQMTLKESHVGRLSRFVYRPSVMFLLGALITTMSMSVSISLSILVPLSARGFVRRENVVPYIMGANITTFVDTVLAALLLNNPDAFTIILANMMAITIVSILILAFAYRRYEETALTFVAWMTADPRHLTVFMVMIVIAPLLLILL